MLLRMFGILSSLLGGVILLVPFVLVPVLAVAYVLWEKVEGKLKAVIASKIGLALGKTATTGKLTIRRTGIELVGLKSEGVRLDRLLVELAGVKGYLTLLGLKRFSDSAFLVGLFAAIHEAAFP